MKMQKSLYAPVARTAINRKFGFVDFVNRERETFEQRLILHTKLSVLAYSYKYVICQLPSQFSISGLH